MKTVGVYQAKARLSSLLARVAKGERITITKHGAPIAVLGPSVAAAGPQPVDVIARLRAFRKGLRLRGLSIRKMIAEGRR